MMPVTNLCTVHNNVKPVNVDQLFHLTFNLLFLIETISFSGNKLELDIRNICVNKSVQVCFIQRK